MKAFLTLLALTICGSVHAQTPRTILSGGEVTDIRAKLVPEKPTVVLFYRKDSSLETQFAERIRAMGKGNIGVRYVLLKTGAEPITRQYEIKGTPTALVYDRRGRLVTRSADPSEIEQAVRKASGVMRLDWAEEGTPLFEAASAAVGGRPLQPGIMRTLSLKPEYLKPFHEMTQKSQMQDGFLPRRTKEMIATYVSALNRCKFCMSGHAGNMVQQGFAPEDVDRVTTGDIGATRLTAKEQGLLEYVKILTLEPSSVRDTHTDRLRRLGWTDEEIFETAFVTSLFSFLNRMADAYGLDYHKKWVPPALRNAGAAPPEL
ncbi:MAG: peroxidase-related enzyme [Capsulimonadales bacterium]|nr:peroxidase-related enzyme [Capsulimonadales bacterium]